MASWKCLRGRGEGEGAAGGTSAPARRGGSLGTKAAAAFQGTGRVWERAGPVPPPGGRASRGEHAGVRQPAGREPRRAAHGAVGARELENSGRAQRRRQRGPPPRRRRHRGRARGGRWRGGGRGAWGGGGRRTAAAVHGGAADRGPGAAPPRCGARDRAAGPLEGRGFVQHAMRRAGPRTGGRRRDRAPTHDPRAVHVCSTPASTPDSCLNLPQMRGGLPSDWRRGAAARSPGMRSHRGGRLQGGGGGPPSAARVTARPRGTAGGGRTHGACGSQMHAPPAGGRPRGPS
jgi:hypothetical protein